MTQNQIRKRGGKLSGDFKKRGGNQERKREGEAMERENVKRRAGGEREGGERGRRKRQSLVNGPEEGRKDRRRERQKRRERERSSRRHRCRHRRRGRRPNGRCNFERGMKYICLSSLLILLFAQKRGGLGK